MKPSTHQLLKSAKYFGLRFLYYRFNELFPFFKCRFLDVTNPKLSSRYVSEKLIHLYNGEIGHGAIKDSNSYLGLGMIHYSLIRSIKPKRVLCVGSQRGYIPAICAVACDDNNQGTVDFVDASFNEEDKRSWGQDGFWKKSDPKQHFLKMKLARIKTYVTTSKEFAQKYPNRKYQYIYIDGDHSYQGVKLDHHLFWPMLDHRGFMAFHDILGKGKFGKSTFGVSKFWSQLSDSNKISINFPRKSGLGILQKK